MNNQVFLTNYKNDLELLFKIHYKKLVTKNINISFLEVAESVFSELNIKLPSLENLDFLKNWYNQIHNLSFLLEISKIENLNEIIIHNNDFSQIHLKNKKENHQISNLSEEDYQIAIEVFAQRNNISWNYSNPFVSFTSNISGISFRVSLIHFSTSATKVSKVFFKKNSK